jgi:hypothetical protein
MIAQVGDRLVVEGTHLSNARRIGVITAVSPHRASGAILEGIAVATAAGEPVVVGVDSSPGALAAVRRSSR